MKNKVGPCLAVMLMVTGCTGYGNERASAENVSFRKKGSLIEISYDLKDRTHVLSYDPETGISKEI